MNFILSAKANRKNAKRHIVAKSEDIEYLRKLGKNNVNDWYIVEIYTGNWKLIERNYSNESNLDYRCSDDINDNDYYDYKR